MKVDTESAEAIKEAVDEAVEALEDGRTDLAATAIQGAIDEAQDSGKERTARSLHQSLSLLHSAGPDDALDRIRRTQGSLEIVLLLGSSLS